MGKTKLWMYLLELDLSSISVDCTENVVIFFNKVFFICHIISKPYWTELEINLYSDK